MASVIFPAADASRAIMAATGAERIALLVSIGPILAATVELVHQRDRILRSHPTRFGGKDMIRLSRRAGLLAVTGVLAIVPGVDPSGTSAQGPAPADLRAAVEGTWQLEEWHV